MVNFNKVHSRLNTEAEKYDSRKNVFGKDDVIPLWVADMDLETPPVIIEALKKRIEHPLFGYTLQSEDLKEATAWWLKKIHNLDVDPNKIGYSTSVASTFSIVIQTFSEVGDNVLYLSPIYGPFRSQTENNDRKPCPFTLELIDGQYQINFEKLEKLILEKKPSLLLFCNPHNPSGRVWTKSELIQLLDLCKKHNIVFFSDEIHSDLVFDSYKHYSVLNSEFKDYSVVIAHSIGKSFNCSGLKASYWITNNDEWRSKLELQFKKSSIYDINVLGKVAMKAVFSEDGVQYRKELLDHLLNNIEYVISELGSNLPQLKVIRPSAGYLVWIDFSKTGLSHDEIQAKLIHKAGVGLSEGLFFGLEGEKFFRINVSVAKSVIEEAISKIIDAFK